METETRVKVKKHFSIRYLAIGDWVTWNKEVYPDTFRKQVSVYGEGPFRVVELQLRYEEAEDISSVMATIELLNGERRQFAGEWFVKVKT